MNPLCSPSGFKNGPAARSLAFFRRTCQIPDRDFGGLWRLRDEELGGLPVCLPPTEPVSWFLHDQALCLNCAHIAFCSRAPGGQPTRQPASQQQQHRDSFHRHSLFSITGTVRSPEHVPLPHLSGNASAPLPLALRPKTSKPEVTRQDGEFCMRNCAIYAR